MFDDYRGLAVFVAVADAGSFSAAGRRLRLSTSVVSHHISRLEERIDTPLFFRSTRSLSLTSEGQRMLDAARRMVQAGEEALDTLSDDRDQLVGALRITLPAFGTNSAVHQAIWQFSKDHPMVAMSLFASDRQVDLIAEGYDLAIRLGRLADSSLKNRKIGVFHRMLVAAPEYLASRPPIETRDDLKKCDFVSFEMLPDEVTLTRDGEDVSFTPENFRIEVDTITAGRAAILAGLGIQNMPLDEIAEDVARGDLVEVLPDWKLPVMGVFAVWPDSGPKKKLTRRLIDALAALPDTAQP